jgi:hypothetical protein
LSDEEERTRLAEQLRRIREAVRERAEGGREAGREAGLPQAREPRSAQPAAPVPEPLAAAMPAAPDGTAVNALWEAHPQARATWWSRLLRRLLAPYFDAQVAFNSQQVQLDNALIAYLEARLARTHRHYDEVLGIHGRHMAEIDERHLILQEELVAHVHDLVRRIDLVLAEGEKGRLGTGSALRDLRARVLALEERLRAG